MLAQPGLEAVGLISGADYAVAREAKGTLLRRLRSRALEGTLLRRERFQALDFTESPDPSSALAQPGLEAVGVILGADYALTREAKGTLLRRLRSRALEGTLLRRERFQALDFTDSPDPSSALA